MCAIISVNTNYSLKHVVLPVLTGKNVFINIVKHWKLFHRINWSLTSLV